MSRLTKSQRNLVIVLLVVLTYAVFDFVKNRDEYLGYYKGGKKNTQDVKKEEKKSINPEVKVLRNDMASTKVWGENPFYDPDLKKAPVRRVVRKKRAVYLKLKAISYSGDNSVAMINDQILSKGDVISGYRVVKIEPKRVVLVKGSEKKILSLR